MRLNVRLVYLLLMIFGGVADVSSIEVEGLRVWSGPESTRVVLDLSATTTHKVFSLEKPNRIVIDLANAETVLTNTVPESGGLITGIRTGTRSGGDLRVVIDLAREVKANTFLLEPNDIYGYRLVVDLMPLTTVSIVHRAPEARVNGGRDLIIAIDAGHGGDDPGASGPRGVHEKNVVLAVARRLATEVAKQPGMRPLLIRDGDYFISLRDRMRKAHSAKADLFVSIHADAFRDSRASGATVYMLSQKGATDEAARTLAERENASDLLGGVSLSDKDDVLAGVLLDLSQSAAISSSSVAAGYLIDRIRRVTNIRRDSVQRAPFLVLKSPDIPSLLIETAYISNPDQERALNDEKFQEDLARAIQDGIVDYFRDYPPPDSYIASHPPPRRESPIRHVISSGETLSEIAERYRVRLATLKSYNRITSDVIQVGQILAIPI